MGKRYQTSQPNLAFTLWGSKGIETVKFVAGEYPQAGVPDLEDEVLIRAIEGHRHFKVLFYEKGQVPDRFGITQERRAEIMASARAILEAQQGQAAEPESHEEAGGLTIPTSAEIVRMRKEEIVSLMASLGIAFDPNMRVLLLKTQLREWIAAKSS
jgi:hypothetical protein